MNLIMLMILPLGITTLLLAVQARWAWIKTQDKILRGMKLDEVLRRAETAQNHRVIATIHSLLAIPAIFLILVLIFSGLAPVQLEGLVPIALFSWLYGLYVPHMLALYIYHLRWNPDTVARKRKLDVEDIHYEGDYRLRDGMQYQLGEDGELIEVEAESEEINRA